MASEANIFILIDALGWTWVKDHPFLKNIAPYRNRLETVLGFSTAAIPSILTGRYPDEHGRLCLFHRAMGKSPFAMLKSLSATGSRAVENRYVRYATKVAMKRWNGFQGYFQLYQVPLRYLHLLDICEKRNIYEPGGIDGSTSVFDMLAARGVDYAAYSYHQGPDLALIRQAHQEIARGVKRFYFLYLAEIDAKLHAFADQPAVIADVLTTYSRELENLYQTARSHYRTVRIHVFSDHGMAPTIETIDVQSRLEKLRFAVPRDYLCLLDSTMARFWFFSDRARVEVMSALSERDGGKWLTEQDLRSLHAYFSDRRYGEEIYLMPEGVVITPSHMGVKAPRGMHGFHPKGEHSFATFISSDDYGDRVTHITDIFSLFEQHAT